jgi:hypothetical protein
LLKLEGLNAEGIEASVRKRFEAMLSGQDSTPRLVVNQQR